MYLGMEERSLASFKSKREKGSFWSRILGKAEGDVLKPSWWGSFGKEKGQLLL